MAKKNNENTVLDELRDIAASKEFHALFEARDAKKAELQRLEESRDSYREQAKEKEQSANKAQAEADAAIRAGEDARDLFVKAKQLHKEAEDLQQLAEQTESYIPEIQPALQEADRRLYNALITRLSELCDKKQNELQREFDSLIAKAFAKFDEWNSAVEMFSNEIGLMRPINKQIKVKADFRTLNFLR